MPSHFFWTSVFWIFLGIFTTHLACVSLITCTLEEVELSVDNSDVWLHCGEHLEALDESSSILCFPARVPTPTPHFKNSCLIIQIESENVMNRCFIILYKCRGWIKPLELVFLTIWGRFLLQRGRFSTKCRYQNRATVMDFRGRRNLRDREVYWPYKWWQHLSRTHRSL